MAKKLSLNGDALDFAKDLFGGSSKPVKTAIKKPIKHKKEEKRKEACPYCNKEYVNVNRHLKSCTKNPDNVVPTEPTVQMKIDTPQATTTKRRVMVIEEEITKPNWGQLITEGVKTLRSLTEYLKEMKDQPIKIQLIK